MFGWFKKQPEQPKPEEEAVKPDEEGESHVDLKA